ncbi:conserved hypothetical pox protein [Squirrelpox virus]|uniref:Conserved hypothetical pox protein n=1 Tax=Squirrelpox virus TaxID=240426 RepID=Q1HTR5_9POXV|nr:conserved hypothetical pox protein [Squirrelpox virus]ABD51471.1 O6R [Squirrelpox virus]CCD83303.1 conserved hypothetical pox protein [Squirrelpox virus]
MDVFNTLRFLESTGFSGAASMLPRAKVRLSHRGADFVFYRPKPSTVQRYMSACGVWHSDVVVLGKVVMCGEKLLLFYMDLCYHGASMNGSLYRLGTSIRSLSLRERRLMARSADPEDDSVCCWGLSEEDYYPGPRGRLSSASSSGSLERPEFELGSDEDSD